MAVTSPLARDASLLGALAAFVGGTPQGLHAARWFYGATIEIYLRVQRKVIDGVPLRVVTIANVAVAEDLRGRGVFSDLLDYLDAHSCHAGLYVESVLDPEQRALYEKRGFHCVDPNAVAPCFFRPAPARAS